MLSQKASWIEWIAAPYAQMLGEKGTWSEWIATLNAWLSKCLAKTVGKVFFKTFCEDGTLNFTDEYLWIREG